MPKPTLNPEAPQPTLLPAAKGFAPLIFDLLTFWSSPLSNCSYTFAGVEQTSGRGSTPMGSHFGVGAPPILVGILVGSGMFTGGTGF